MASKRRNVRKRPARPPAPRPASSPWKRPLVWTGSIAGALILAVATAFGTGLGQKLVATLTTAPHAGPPVIINAEYMQQSRPNFAVVVPTQKDLNSLPGPSSGFQKYIAAVNTLGGALVTRAYVQVVLRGNRTEQVVVSGISVLKHCQAPLNGIENSENLGLVEIVGIGFNLDSAFPVAEVDDAGNLSGDFFAHHAISLGDGQTQTLLISVTTYLHFCRFSFQLSVDPPAGHEVTENVTDHGRLFSVSAENP